MNFYVIVIIALFTLCCIFGIGFIWWMHLLDEIQEKYHEKVQRVEELENKIKTLTGPIRIETYMTEPVNINLSFELNNTLRCFPCNWSSEEETFLKLLDYKVKHPDWRKE